MRIVAVRTGESRAGDRLIDQALCLRARVFQGRLEWNVSTENGREFDEYDQLGPTYILATDDRCVTVIGCARLLPGDGPTMLADTFPQLLDGKPMPRGRDIVESSRFCVDTSVQGSSGALGLHQATMGLFAGILEWSFDNGCTEVVTVTDLRIERIFGRAGLPFERLGSPQAIGNTIAVAGTIPVTAENAARVRPVGLQPLVELGWDIAA
ncbi:MAG: acyl-homoserine-lactone synthase [Rhizobiaceae bacterium]